MHSFSDYKRRLVSHIDIVSYIEYTADFRVQVSSAWLHQGMTFYWIHVVYPKHFCMLALLCMTNTRVSASIELSSCYFENFSVLDELYSTDIEHCVNAINEQTRKRLSILMRTSRFLFSSNNHTMLESGVIFSRSNSSILFEFSLNLWNSLDVGVLQHVSKRHSFIDSRLAVEIKLDFDFTKKWWRTSSKP